MKASKQRIQVSLVAMVICLGARLAGAATAYTWTNTTSGFSGNWGVSANWNPATSTPGAVSGDSAYLTNSATGTYTSILDASPANSLSTLFLRNPLGEAWLVITNAALSTTSFTPGNGTRLQLDQGGSLLTVNAVNFGLNTSGTTGLVTSAGAVGGNWNFSVASLAVGNTGSSNALTINKVALTNTSDVTLGVNAGDSYNSLTMSNGARLVVGAAGKWIYVGSANNASYNVLNVGGLGASVTVTNFRVRVGYSNASGGNTLNLTNATLIGGNDHSRLGEQSSSNTVNVLAGGTWNNNGMWFHMPFTSGNGNELTINGGTLTNVSNFTLGTTASSHGNKVVLTNGGKMFISQNLYLGQAGNNNSLAVAAGGMLDLNGTGLSIGSTTSVTGNVVTVTGGMITNLSNISVGTFANSLNNSLLVNNGGQLLINTTNNRVTIGGAVAATGNSVTLGGVGTPVVMTNYPVALTVGSSSGSVNTLTITNALIKGHTSSTSSYIGQSGSSSNTMNVLAGGSYHDVGGYFEMGMVSTGNVLNIDGGFFSTFSVLWVGRNAGNCGNRVTVSNGGILEAATLTCNDASGTGNTITNAGGVYQFASASPALNPNGAGSIVINSGAVSFRGINNADVNCNQGSGPLISSKLSWAGKNAFRLNNATNSSTGQGYAFADTGNATNFVRLELVNSSLYRGGAVTIGANGSLLISNGVSTISSNLTFDPSATFSVDLSRTNTYGALVVQGNVVLGNCALNINLGSAPVAGSSFTIISSSTGATSGSFATSSQVVTVNNTNYIVRVNTTSSGATVTCNLRTMGTRLIIE